MQNIFTSKRFLTLLTDLVVSLVVYFGVKYAAPSAAEDIKFVVAALQPAVIAVIAAYGAEDYALARKQ